jgi:hypothetical protein
MALPILRTWKNYFTNPHEGLGSSYERIVLNDLLGYLRTTYRIRTVLEAPIFGFTGLTGLNSVVLAQQGCDVTLLDNDPERASLVSELLSELRLTMKTLPVTSFTELKFPDRAFDFSWNFSSLWFVEHLDSFLAELSRVTTKAILICVPNQHGLGYKWQKAHADIPDGITFHEEFINPDLIKQQLQQLNWQFIQEAYIDCPLWPDIGMNKESWFARYLPSLHHKQAAEPAPKQCISIMDYYQGKDPAFVAKMRQYAAFEDWAPIPFKKLWSHHHWMLFAAPQISHQSVAQTSSLSGS